MHMKLFLRLMTVLFIGFILAGCQSNQSTYTVSFDTGGGTVISDIEVTSGELAQAPEDPTRDYFIFDGWFLDQFHTQSYTFDTPVTKSIKLYAKWVANESEVLALIDADILALEIHDLDDTQTKIHLPRIGSVHQSLISWASHQKDVILDSGIVLNPKVGEPSATVKLTATLTLMNVTKSVDFEVVVPPKGDVSIGYKTDKTFSNLTSEYIVEDALLTSFYTPNGSLPYVDIQSFLTLLDGLVMVEELEFVFTGHTMTISYIVTEEITNDLNQVIETITTDYVMFIDFEANTVEVNELSFFDGYIKATQTEYGEGITYLDPYFEKGGSVIFDLNHHRMDLVVHTDEDDTYYLFPFHLANLLFLSGTYYNVYYNGNGYYGIYGIPSASSEGESLTMYQTIKTSSFNNTDIPSDVLVASYDLLAFSLNYFYGLKKELGIEDYYQQFGSYRDVLLGGHARDFSSGLFRFINRNIDDLHTSFAFPGYYNDLSYTLQLTSLAQLGTRVRAWYDVYFEVSALRDQTFPNGAPNYRMIDQNRTLIIYLDSFDTATVDNPEGADSDRFMRETLTDAFSKYSNIQNIVVDLSNNTGGNLGALLRVLGYLTDEPLEMSFKNPLDGSNVTYFADVDRVAYSQQNWYIMTSKVTFSAANLMTAIAQHMGIATIIGTTSGGGASSITPMVLPDGSFFIMSSLNVLSLRSGNLEQGYTYQSIEYGIDPDIILPVKDLYNDQKLIEAINASR